MISSVVAALRLFGGWNAGHAVGDRLDAGEGGAAGREGAQDEEHRQQPAGVRGLAQRGSCALSAVIPSPNADLGEADGQHRVDREHEPVGGDRERASGLLDAAKVDRRRAATTKPSDSATACGASDGTALVIAATPADHRHGDGEHVVDQQRRRRRPATRPRPGSRG